MNDIAPTPGGTDTAIVLETPEGTIMELHPAGVPARALAFLIDEMLRWTIIVAAFSVAGFLGFFGQGLALIVFFLCYWLYGVAFEVLNNGVTPGKRLRGLQVIHDDGTPVALPASVLRNLLLWADLLPVFYVTGIVSMVLTRRFQRLGDLAAGTLVVYQPDVRSHSDAGVGANASLRVPVQLTQDEQATLVDFLERADSLTPERRDELAELVAAPLGLAADAAASEVLGLAAALRGV